MEAYSTAATDDTSTSSTANYSPNSISSLACPTYSPPAAASDKNMFWDTNVLNVDNTMNFHRSLYEWAKMQSPTGQLIPITDDELSPISSITSSEQSALVTKKTYILCVRIV